MNDNYRASLRRSYLGEAIIASIVIVLLTWLGYQMALINPKLAVACLVLFILVLSTGHWHVSVKVTTPPDNVTELRQPVPPVEGEERRAA